MNDRQQCEPGVNALRFLLMFPIIMAHGWWFAGTEPSSAAYRLLITGQCSVPVFFITSGYLLRWQEGDRLAVARWSLRKLLPLFIIWSLIYFAAGTIAGIPTSANPLKLLIPGAATPHLWFLPALGIALAVTSVSLRYLGLQRTWLLASGVAAIGLVSGTYLMALGWAGHSLRANMLTAPLLVLLGVWLATVRLPRLPMLTVLIGIVVVLAYFLQLFEDRLLASTAGYVQGRRLGVTLSTFPYALAVFLFARSLPDWRPIDWLAKRKNVLLVVYCIHPIMLVFIGRAYHQRGLVPIILVSALAYAMSVVAALALAGAHRRWREFRAMHRHRLEVAVPPAG